jgi:SAM-dependent methyltransferase
VAACGKYCAFDAHRFLEPACGTGRLIIELTARGYQVTGFDLSQPALSYLRRHLAGRRLQAEAFEAEMFVSDSANSWLEGRSALIDA